MVNVGIVGIGNMGSAHAACIAQGQVSGMALKAVCDIDIRRAQAVADEHPSVLVYTDYKQMFSEAGLDAVVIAVPHPLHSEIAAAAFSCGLHVMLEKPMDISVSKAQTVIEAAEKSGKVFGIMFNQRTNPLYQRAREIVQSGQLGKLQRTVWIMTRWYRTQHYYDSGSWRATWAGEGGGVLVNQAPHNLDLWQWICGMPESVTAFCNIAQSHSIDVEDDATVFTRYKNGATGVFIVSTCEYPGTNRLEISGELGKLVLEDGVLKWWKLKENASDVVRASDKNTVSIETEYVEITSADKGGSHRGILQNFTNAILYGEQLLSPGIEGVNELSISNAAYLSQWTGNREVSLPFDTKLFDEKLNELAEGSKVRAQSGDFVPTTEYDSRWQVNW